MAQAQTAVLQADPAQDKATAAKPSNVRWRIFAIVFALTVINLVDRVSLSIAMPTIAGEFQLTPSMQGLILSSFFWAYALLQIPGGWLIDRYGPRRVIGWSTGLWGAFQTLAAFASGGLSLMFARVALGAAEAPLFPSGGKLNSLWLGSSERSRGAVLMDCGGPLGVALGGLVIAYLIAVLGSWRSAFFIAGIATLAMAWLAWHYLRDDPAEHPGVNAAELDRINADRTTPLAEADCQAGGRLGIAGRSLVGIVLGRASWAMVFFGLLTWGPSYLAQARGFDIKGIGAATFVIFLCGAVVAWADLDQLGRGQPPVTALRGVEHVPQVVKEVVIEDLLAKGLAVGDEVGEPFGLAAMELGDQLVLVLGAGLKRGQGSVQFVVDPCDLFGGHEVADDHRTCLVAQQCNLLRWSRAGYDGQAEGIARG